MTASDLTRTATVTEIGAGEDEEDGAAPRLVIAMTCREPWIAGARLSLHDVDEVVLGRGRQRGWSRDGRRLLVELADPELSRRHLRLRRLADGWEGHDEGSKNGTTLNGAPLVRGGLLDGDLVEIGTTMLVFREAGRACDGAASVDAPGGRWPDRDLASETAGPMALRSLSIELERVAADLARLAPARVPILIRGETGTGKELVAQAIHAISGRVGPLVPVNCGALPSALVESELFGYKRGAFSGARDDRDGLIGRADRGTLFLDEIAELPEASQVALLRVLQEGEVRPIGSSSSTRVDVQVVAATHQDLTARIADGRFRQDLYARLAGHEVYLPPLRGRREDVGSLIAALLPRVVGDPSRVMFQRQAARALMRHNYPLNVRELEQALRSAIALASGGEVRLGHLPEAIRVHAAPPAVPMLRAEDSALREQLIELLAANRGNVSAVGRAFGKAPVQIRRWCRRFGIDPTPFRD